jgi:hypothetical protein
MLQIDLIEIAPKKPKATRDMHSVLICCDAQHIASFLRVNNILKMYILCRAKRIIVCFH